MENELISIIIPVYNCEEYLEICIKSVLNQTYDKFELILINDGSKDSSGEICKKYSNIDKRVIYINQNNIGVSRTRQKGINISKGEYLTFIDSDDYIDKNYLLNLYNNIKQSNSDIICCNSIDFGVINYENNKIKKNEIILEKKRLIEDYFNGMRYAYCIWGKLYKKSIIKMVKFRDMQYAEDTCMIVELFMKSTTIQLLNYDGYYYRGQESSVTHTVNSLKKYNDLTIRSKLIYDICCENFCELKQKAIIQLINDLYGFISKYLKEKNKFEYKQLYDNYINVYFNIERKYLLKNKKGIMLILFNINEKLIKKFLNIYYKFKIV